MVTVCGRNFGFDKTESFKTSMVTVEVGGAPCKLLRQDYVNRCAEGVWPSGGPAAAGGWGGSFLQLLHQCNCQKFSPEGNMEVLLYIFSAKTDVLVEFFHPFGDQEPPVTSPGARPGLPASLLNLDLQI